MKLEEFDTLPAPRAAMQNDPESTPLLQWLRAQQAGKRIAPYASGASPGSLFLHTVLVWVYGRVTGASGILN